jgi:hypothetical protein
MEKNYWRKCGRCKQEISWGGTYQQCSVSSCRKFAYCSVDCWSVHNSVMGHMSAYAQEEKVPNKNGDIGIRRKIIISAKQSSALSSVASNVELDVLIVASKLKKYVKDRHNLSTSANVIDRLSELVRDLVDGAVVEVRQEERKTLMDRDFK